jgi:hypothetical protein
MSVPGMVDIGGILVPVEVIKKAQSYANNKNDTVGIWEAENPHSGILGFILIPIKYKSTDSKRSLIKGYFAPVGSSPEQIPDPIYEVQPDEEGMEIWPIETQNRERGYATVEKLENPTLDLSGYASSSAQFMMKKADWIEIGKKAGWIKTASIIKNKETESENYKQALPIAAALPYVIPVLLSAAPSIIGMFSGNKEEAQEYAENAAKNPEEMRRQTQQASEAQARLEKVIQNLTAYAAKLSLPCASMKAPTKCTGSEIKDMNTVNKKMQELESAYKNISKNYSGDPCRLLQEAHNLNVCAKSIIQLNAMITNGLNEIQQSGQFDLGSFGA